MSRSVLLSVLFTTDPHHQTDSNPHADAPLEYLANLQQQQHLLLLRLLLLLRQPLVLVPQLEVCPRGQLDRQPGVHLASCWVCS